jgi:hypothetical protein
MEAWDEMQLLYSKSNDFERHLARSYLLEHGVAATQVIREINGEESEASNSGSAKSSKK